MLANEQVEAGACWRCGTPVIHKEQDGWFLKISQYAQEFLDWRDFRMARKVLITQRNWIGRSAGAKIPFDLENGEESIQVFTTRHIVRREESILFFVFVNPLPEDIKGVHWSLDVKSYLG
jgi:leucyl-tRNA synthetase